MFYSNIFHSFSLLLLLYFTKVAFSNVDYGNLRIIYNVSQSCGQDNDDIRSCEYQNIMWLKSKEFKVYGEFSYHHVVNDNLKLCFRHCQKYVQCKTVTKQDKNCMVYGRKPQLVSATDDETSTYFLKCCIKYKLVKKDGLENLPIVYNLEKDCDSFDENLAECNNYAWLYNEEITFNTKEMDYDEEKTDLNDCLQWCLNTLPCIGVMISKQSKTCYIYSNLHTSPSSDASIEKNITYSLTCCRSKEIKRKFEDPTMEYYIPVIDNVENDCYPPIKSNEKLPSCEYKAWLFKTNVILYKSMETKELQPKQCFERCLQMSGCVAVLTTGLVNPCWLYNDKYTVEEGEGYYAYFLTCCKVKRRKMNIIENLPIIKTTQKDCYENDQKLETCESLAWIRRRSFTLKYYLETGIMNVKDCLKWCLKTPSCVAVATIEDKLNCSIFSKFHVEKPVNSDRFDSYFLKCCEIKDRKQNPNYPNYIPFIKSVDECYPNNDENVKTCINKAWIMKEKTYLRTNNPEITHSSNNPNECFEMCLTNRKCIAVLICNLSRESGHCPWKCWLILESFREMEVHYTTSYILTCCRLKKIRKEGLENLPVVYDFNKECYPSRASFDSCDNFVWLNVNKIYLMEEFGSVSDGRVTMVKCDSICLARPTCVGVKKYYAIDACTLFSKYQTSISTDVTAATDAFTLSCCTLKSKTKTQKENYDLPIVVDQKTQCFDEGNTLVNPCKYNKAWHMTEQKAYTLPTYLVGNFDKVIDCLNVCINHTTCIAVVVELKDIFNKHICQFYKYNGAYIPNDVKIEDRRKTAYELICCKVNFTPIVFKSMFLYQPNRICQKVRLGIYKEDCPVKIWHVEEGVALNSDRREYLHFPGFWSDVLNKCEEKFPDCAVVSFYIKNYGGFYLYQTYREDAKKRLENANAITFTLKCCDPRRPLSLNSQGDSPEYIDLPMFQIFEKDCLSSLKSCPQKAWHYERNLTLVGQTIDKPNYLQIQNCLNYCLKTPQCVAVTINQTNKQCVAYKQGFEKKTPAIGIKLYSLECCTINKFKIFNKQNLPIVFNSKEDCTSKGNSNCKYKSWLMQENTGLVVLTEYDKFFNHDPIECLNDCVDKSNCVGVVIENVNEFETICYHYENPYKYDLNNYKKKNDKKILYEIICCNVKDESLWKYKDTNLLILYEPSKVCEIVSSIAVLDCSMTIWHVTDGNKRKGHYSAISLNSIQNCLNECSESVECFSVSIDFVGNRCLFFHENKFTEHFGQFSWSSFTKKCCQM